ncbi:hypothetical protein LNTAR_15717 [Lentisphaera araneosa HTCC2155]|uniref:DUF1722 domain-containing protein n=1 Tax=Lentisphaera araneosa HTCC2155 TaxID=313628 RepID=A6DME1_9BACT|nr:DUF523 and DUF1722 domain-containing protein [Lentisphaera araneosa]EDM27131.1 hypothetical protein LNTAR_15717 [Lentisphaera araneosa HTCC2155]
MQEKIKIGLSACLSGDEVRYNGQGCRDKLVMDQLHDFFDYVKVCPEMAIGLGTPRPTIRLVQHEKIRLQETKGDGDYTEKMEAFAKEDMERLKKLDLCGFIFKKGSPSCGAYRVKIYSEEGHPLIEKTAGMYALQVKKNFPWLPIEEDGRLNDAPLFENFIFRAFALNDWQQMLRKGLSHGGLHNFHRRHKYALMAHSHEAVNELGNYIAHKGDLSIEVMAESYLSRFMDFMSKPPKRLQHANVLYHLLGYFKKDIDAFDKEDTVKMIEQYRKGYIPLVVPITRISHYTQKYEQEYLMDQSYLERPDKLGLLNKL